MIKGKVGMRELAQSINCLPFIDYPKDLRVQSSEPM